MNKEMQAHFMQRWNDIKSSIETHPYAKWITVVDPSTDEACLALHGKIWRVDGPALRNLIAEHLRNDFSNCRCRLCPVAMYRIERDHLETMD